MKSGNAGRRGRKVIIILVLQIIIVGCAGTRSGDSDVSGNESPVQFKLMKKTMVTLEGNVMDHDSIPLKHCHVSLHWDWDLFDPDKSEPTRLGETFTDSEGHYILPITGTQDHWNVPIEKDAWHLIFNPEGISGEWSIDVDLAQLFGETRLTHEVLIDLSGRAAGAEPKHLISRWISATRANLRAGPSTDTRIKNKMWRGTEVIATDSSGEWLFIEIQPPPYQLVPDSARTGWLHNTLVSLDSVPLITYEERTRVERGDQQSSPTKNQKPKDERSASWRTVTQVRVLGELLGLEDPADVVFDVLTSDYSVAEADVAGSGDGMMVTHHYRVGNRYIDVTFARSYGQYRVAKIRVKD